MNFLQEERRIRTDISIKRRTNALAHFDSLLKKTTSNSKPKESEWQNLFETYPFIFTETIPVRFDMLIPEYKFGSGRADFLFHQRSDMPLFSTTGLIEIKRPDNPIIDIYGSHLNLSRSTSRAITQLKDYIRDLESGVLLDSEASISVGNSRIAFVIVGLSEEISRKCYTETRQLQFQRLLPPGFQILPFDLLFKNLSKSIPRKIIFLTAREKIHHKFKVIVISGYPAAGKTSLLKELLEHPEKVDLPMSAFPKITTRAPRNHEIQSGELSFTSEEIFNKKTQRNEIMFDYQAYGQQYGFEKSTLFRLARNQGFAIAILGDNDLAVDFCEFLKTRDVNSSHVHLYLNEQKLIRRLKLRNLNHNELEMRVNQIKNRGTAFRLGGDGGNSMGLNLNLDHLGSPSSVADEVRDRLLAS
jgi:guanylate kinase